MSIPRENPGAVALKNEKVILIHGTFASASKDLGDAWWQVGSPTYGAIRERLPEHIDLVGEGELFHWSGENHERARNKAAHELLNYLKPLEDSGTRYHLIGHSHGGSVIWAALRLATAHRSKLNGLRSWATVGTPFLHHRSRSPWHSINLFYMLLAAMLLIPAARVFMTLALLPYNLYAGNMQEGLVMRTSSEAGLVTSVLRAPFVELLRGCGVPFTATENGYRIGSYEPESGQSVSEFLLMTAEGWLILAAIAALGYLLLLLGSWFVGPVLEALRISWENRLERRAFERFRGRWLAVWTPEDEAINGLRATGELSVKFLAKLVPRERIFISDTLALVSRPWFWLVAPLYNLFVRPVLDSAIRDVVVRSAQGNNRPAARVVAVAPSPLLAPDAPLVPPLPELLGAEILSEADRHASFLGASIRQLLAQPNFTAGIEKFNSSLSGKELVHTSYFDHTGVIDLLVANITCPQGIMSAERNKNLAIGMKFASREVASWFVNFKNLLASGPAPLTKSNETGSLNGSQAGQQNAA